MAIIDYIIIGTFLIGLVYGFIRGFMRQIFSLGGIVLGLILGSMLYKPFAGFLSGVVTMRQDVAETVAFVIILILVPIVCGVVGHLLSKLVKAVNLGLLDRLLGALSGVLVWFLLAGMAIKLMEITGMSDTIRIKGEENGDSSGKESVLYAPTRDVSAACLQWTWKKVLETDLPAVIEMGKDRINAGDDSDE